MKRARLLVAVLVTTAMSLVGASAYALGEDTRVEIVGVDLGADEPRETARRRLAWEVRKRTSIETRLAPRRARLDDQTIFETPFLYLAGDEAFEPRSEAEVRGLRRFIEFGGFLLIDDASPHEDGFDLSVRRLLRRAFPTDPLAPVPPDHTVFHSFYLLRRPAGRVRGPEHLFGITRGGRLAVAYSRHDLGGALARDNLGTYRFEVTPDGERQREVAARLGVNIVMYALCLDYKDDQVHAPFIMRRRPGRVR